jgi:flagellar hook-associated protein 2
VTVSAASTSTASTSTPSTSTSSTATAASLSNLGSGIDVQSLISGLVAASSGPLDALQTQQTSTQSAISTLSSVGTTLSQLQSAVSALNTPQEVGSYAASTSSSAIAASASGTALPGNYSVTVSQLAQEQRTYSNTFASSSTALGQSGTLSIQVGTGTASSIQIASTDTLDQIANKINAAGLRVTASTFFDGTNYRLQVRGLDSGKSNNITLTQSGMDIGFANPANTVQQAQNSIIQLDGFSIQRSTNQVVGAIQGVTLALTATSTDPVNVQVSSDPQGLETKLQAVATAYNAVISGVNAAAGTSSVAASSPVLAGDTTLRSISTRLSDTLQTSFGTGTYSMLGSIGLALQSDGTLALDTSKLEAALNADPTSVTRLLAGTNGTDGAMSKLSSAIDTFNENGTGMLSVEESSMQDTVTDLGTRITEEQSRLAAYQNMLQSQFDSMNTLVASNNSDMNYLTRLYSNTSNSSG